MSDRTSIAWTDCTWNPVRGCSLVSKGCESCYAMKQARRFSAPGQPYHGLTMMGPQGPRWNGTIRLVPELLDEPLHWKKPRRVFVNSMSDLFHEDVPLDFIADTYAIMITAYRHTFQVLTKRPCRRHDLFTNEPIREMIAIRAAAHINKLRGPHSLNATRNLAAWNAGTASNIWEGASIEDQKTADERIPLLLQTPAAVRWISAEPLLGPVDLRLWLNVIPRMRTPVSADSGLPCGETTLDLMPSYNINTGEIIKPLLDWVVCGGESGPKARPCDVAWVRSIVQQCRAAGVPCFVKQLGAKPYTLFGDGDGAAHTLPMRLKDKKGGDPAEWTEDLRIREFPR